ncbi:TPA: hypothetical protein EYO57_18665 [Candidatus Poribacteria bacterium]|nr:hypothetical protein [Candidatus Poribacteria bacterium]
MMGLPTGQKRQWGATVWPSKKISPAGLEERLLALPDLRFIEGQWEACPKTGRHHVHLYLEFKKSKRAAWLAKRLSFKDEDGGAWPDVEAIRSSAGARDYFTKESGRLEGTSPIKWGNPSTTPIKTKRANADSAATLIEQGWSAEKIAYHRPDLYLRFGMNIERCLAHRDIYLEKSIYAPAKRYREGDCEE